MFYGREYELNIIKSAIASNRAELGIVYGRRRVGKSTLLEKARRRTGNLYFEGLQRASQKKQIDHFMRQLAEQTGKPQSAARDWREALEVLSFHIADGRKYVVFDEFSWMASGRTELVALLKFFWDNRWKKNPDLTVVICGSIASFMLKHIVHSKALHNRKTFEINLAPMPAFEAKLFFKKYRSDFEIAKLLMVFGGIPKYLEQIDPRRSFEENVDRLCFRNNAFFVTEFDTIFKEQFKVIKKYEKILRALAEKSCSNEELVKHLRMSPGGGLSSYLRALEQASFIKLFTPNSFMKTGEKTRKWVLWDEWLRFYFTFIEPHKQIIELNTEPGLFDKLSGRSLDSFFGLSFERFCMKNLHRLFKNIDLDIHDIVGYGPFFRQRKRDGSKNEGLQIDILLRRKRRILTLIECKFTPEPVGMSVVEEVQRKVEFLKAPKNVTVERVLISAGGVNTTVERSDYFHHIAGLNLLL